MNKRYRIDSQRSRFTVQAFATGLLAGFAHSPVFAVRDYQGEIQWPMESSDEAAFQMTIRASSLELTDQVKEGDRTEIQRQLMQEVLEVDKYPEISFRSTKIAPTKIADNWFRSQIEGDMKLHGMTKSLQADSQVRILDQEVRLSGEFSLLLSAFKIKRVSALGGMIKLKDELKFVFDFIAREEARG